MKPSSEFVRPRPGYIVRKPLADGGGFLNESGELVPTTSYWRRRIKTGEVIVGKAIASRTKPKADKAEPQE